MLQRTQSACELRIAARHERRRFFVPDLDETDLVLPLAKRFDDPVHAVSGKAEYRIDTPVNQLFR